VVAAGSLVEVPPGRRGHARVRISYTGSMYLWKTFTRARLRSWLLHAMLSVLNVTGRAAEKVLLGHVLHVRVVVSRLRCARWGP